jgi:hypothetical protein
VKVNAAKNFAVRENYKKWISEWEELIKIDSSDINLLRGQAIDVFTDLMSDLESYIIQGDEIQTKSKSNEIKKYYDRIRYIDCEYDSYQSIQNLNDKYIVDATIYAKINSARTYSFQKDYDKWLSKWEELNIPLKEKDKIDLFNFQAYQVFDSIISQLNSYKQNEEASSNVSNLTNAAINYLHRANRINENFNNYIEKTELKNKVSEESLEATEISSQVGEAQKLVSQKKFIRWYNVWKSIAPLNYSIKVEGFKKQSVDVFDNLLFKLTENIENGDTIKTISIANQIKDIYISVLDHIDANYQKTINEHPEIYDLNIIYLNSASCFSVGYNYLNQKKYKKAIEFVRNYLSHDSIIQTTYYVNFVKNVTNQLISDLNSHYLSVDFKSESIELATLNYILSSHKEISFDIPKYLNKNNDNIFAWYESRLNDFIDRISKIIEYEIQIANYEKAIDTTIFFSKFSINDSINDLIKKYHTKISYKGSQYYLDSSKILQIKHKYAESQALIDKASKIDKSIENNALTLENNDLNGKFLIQKASDTIIYNEWLLGLDYAMQAKDLLSNNSMAIRKIDSIRKGGKIHYEKMLNISISQKDWTAGHQYCKYLETLLPNYDLELCNDKISFEEIISIVRNYFNKGCYKTALTKTKNAKSLNLSDNDERRLNDLIDSCENKSTIKVDILPIFNLTNETNSFFPFNLKTLREYALQEVNEIKPEEFFECRYSGDRVDAILEEFEKYLRSHSEIAPVLRNYKLLNTSVDYLIGINILEYEYKFSWSEEEMKEVCLERTKLKDEEEISSDEYYDSDGSGNGGSFYRKRVPKRNAKGEILGTWYNRYDGNRYFVEDKVSKYYKKAKLYKYSEPITFEKKSGSEMMHLKISISLYDIQNFNIHETKVSNFSLKNFSYKKYSFLGENNPTLNNLYHCPSKENIGKWLTNKNERFRNTSPFKGDSNPFKGASQIYESYYSSKVHRFITNQIVEMINFIEKNNKYECE